MSLPSELIIFSLLLMFVTFTTADPQTKNDEMCRITRDVLCVKDVLMVIATVARSINRTTYEIEKLILSKAQVVQIQTLNRYVNFEMSLIHSHLPTPQYHAKFFQVNNIDKKYLVDLLLEAHNAMSYYYNSINDILNMNDVFAFSTDSWFKQIQYNLRYEVICRYRSVMNVYSHDWPLINEINEIPFSTRKYRNSPSLVHDVHSLIIARLLREWMSRMQSVIVNLEAKFF